MNNEEPAVIALLLDSGADIHARDYDTGWTPLHWAARYNGEPSVIALLLDRGADSDARDELGNAACQLTESNTDIRESVTSTEVLRQLCR